jgi:predicted acylesterase/phospholipase RssA
MKEFADIPAPEALRSAQVGAGARDARTTNELGTPRDASLEAVCFTAGVDGTPFAAGVTHAYLAADRPPPAVIAGISSGALSAAAMAASFEELASCHEEKERNEARRWRWFRSYLDALANRPLDVFWRGLPSFAEFSTLGGRLRPLPDPAIPQDSFLKEAERDALKRRFLLQHLGQWICHLPLKMKDIAGLFVNSAVARERNIGTWWERCMATARFLGLAVLSVLQFLLHLVVTPQFLNQAHYLQPTKSGKRRSPRLRPLFGWRGWLGSTVIFVLLLTWFFTLIGLGLGMVLGGLHSFSLPRWPAMARWIPDMDVLQCLKLGAIIAAAPVAVGLLVSMLRPLTTWLAQQHRLRPLAWLAQKAVDFFSKGNAALVEYLIERTGITRALLSDFYLLHFLAHLFADGGRRTRTIGSFKHSQLLLVAAPLQTIPRKPDQANDAKAPGGQPRGGKTHQLWAAPGTDLIAALRASLALPGLFEPIRLSRERFSKAWQGAQSIDFSRITQADLVDGAVIRNNPLPALFTFLDPRQKDQGSKLGDEIERANTPERPGIHVVYSIAVDKRELGEAASREDVPDIVEAAQKSLRLARRCDTELEVIQTNFMSGLEKTIRDLQPQQDAAMQPLRCIYADEIAPASHEPFQNQVAPTRDEVLRLTAEGCRRTLGRLYAREILTHPQGKDTGKLQCKMLLSAVAKRREQAISQAQRGGCAEVCGRCTHEVEVLQELQRAQRKEATQPRESALPFRADHFPQLRRDRPRVVLVTSGGVFRGAFHVGLAGALLEIGLQPDLIVGASVGTLIGAVTGALFHLEETKARKRLQQLAKIFLEVDQQVTHTRSLLSAVRTLALRATAVNLSPREVIWMLQRGAREDAGFAAVGAPPALLDALADMFLFPHRETAEMASSFVTGKFAEALRQFLHLLRQETLPRLDVREALLGTSLLELRARELLDLSDEAAALSTHLEPDWWTLGSGGQPFMGPPGDPKRRHIAFFGTATDLWTESLKLLGGEAPEDEPYDIVEAALASSAFPAIFSPRRESQIRPGVGRSDVVFADGGMFDNLPFIPAINVLRSVQLDELKPWENREKVPDAKLIQSLEDRRDNPDLFIVGALNVNPEETDAAPVPYQHLPAIFARAGSLRDNVKIRTFQRASRAVDRQIQQLVEAAKQGGRMDSSQRQLIAGVVNSAILPVFPTSRDHLNPTFAFTPSTGFAPERVGRSIGDGCYQTLRTLALEQAGLPQEDQRTRALRAVRNAGKLKDLRRRTEREDPRAENRMNAFLCPFFEKVSDSGQGERFECPFVEEKKQKAANLIFRQCISDPMHG